MTAAGYGVLARHVAPGRDPVIVTPVQMLGALMIAVPIFLTSVARGQSYRNRRRRPPTLATMVGLLGGIIPFLLFNGAITELTASRASIIGVLVPVVGAAASILLLHEPITALALTGGCFALFAAFMAARREDDPCPPHKTASPLADMTVASTMTIALTTWRRARHVVVSIHQLGPRRAGGERFEERPGTDSG